MAPDGSTSGFAGPVVDVATEHLHQTDGDNRKCERGQEAVPPGEARRQAQTEFVARMNVLETEIVTAAAQIAAATHRFLTALRAFDEQRGWELHGRKSAADWLSWRAGMSLGIAREKVRVAHALANVPRIDEALRKAEISFSKARAMTRVATPENEGDLLVTARCATAHQLEVACRKFRYLALDRIEGQPHASRLEGRFVRFRDRDDGYVSVVIQCLPEEAAEIRAALDASCGAARALARRAIQEAAVRSAAVEGNGLVARESDECSLGATATAGGDAHCDGQRHDDGAPFAVGAAAGSDDDDTDDSGPAPSRRYFKVWRPPEEVVQRSTFNRVDAALAICRAFIESPRFAAGHRPRCEVFVEVGRETLSGTSTEPALLADGTALAPETARRLCCDSAIVPTSKGEDGSIVAIGRRSRTVPAPLARALRLRDKWCRFPGCVNTISLDAHHVVHWARGGETSMENLARLCAYHHWCMHEGGFTAATEAGHLVFRDPRGEVVANAPPLGADGGTTLELEEWLHQHGPDPEWALPIPIGDGRADWSLFVECMADRTYGHGSYPGPRMPLPDGTAPPRAQSGQAVAMHARS